MSRRFVFGVVAAVLAVMVLGGIAVWAAGGGGSRTAALEESTSSGSRGFNWYLFGGTGGQTFWADLESVAGCDAQGEVATVKDPATGDVDKHISGVVPSVCRLQATVNARANGALYDWINDTLSETYIRKDLTLLKEVGPNQFMSISLDDVLIERIELPAFQGVSTAAPATVGLTLRPEASTRNSTAGVTRPTAQKPPPATTNVVPVALTGLGSLRASRFEPWSADVKITRAAAGANQLQVYEATETSLGDLGFSIPFQTREGFSNAGQLQSLHDWFDSAVTQQGSSSAAAERTLTLALRDPATNAVVLTVSFTNVGIFAQPSYWLGNDPEKFLFYAEGASFVGVPAAPAPAPPPPPPVAPPPPPPPPPAAEGPPAPTNVKAVVEGTIVVLSWEAVEGKYEVLVGQEPGGPYEQITTTEEPTARFELRDGTHYVVVRAVTAEGESPNSDEVVVQVPGSPLNLKAVVEGTVVVLTWQPIEAKSYAVLYGKEPGGPYEQVAETQESTAKFEFSEPGTYYVVVRAVVAEAEPTISNEVVVEIAG